MKSSVENVSNLERKLSIEVPGEAVQKSMSQAYAEVRKSAEIRGFRKGKAPLDKIKELYAAKITPDVLNDLVDENYRKALNEHSLIPIDMPQVEIDEFSEESGLKFTATLETRPDVELKKYEELNIQREAIDVSEEKVDKVLEDIRQSRPEFTPLFEERPVQDQDVAVIDFKGFLADGSELPGGAGTDHKLEIGSNQFIPGFEEGVIGMTIGSEKDVSVTFPEDYHAQEIAGRPVTFKVNLKAIEKKSLPELNDEFAKKVGEHESLDELKEAIRKDIRMSEEGRINNEMKDRILKTLVKENPMDAPRSMVEKQKQHLVEDMKQKMQQQGLGDEQFEEYKKKWDEDFDKTASTMVKSSFLISAIAEKHELRATDADFEKKMQDYAAETGIEVDRLREFYGKAEQRSRLGFQLTEDKVIDLILEKANIEEVSKDKIKEVEG